MKKFLAFALALITLTVFVSCSSPKVEIKRGSFDGDIYKNEVLGFEFKKPASWVYSTDEEIAAAMNTSEERVREIMKTTLRKHSKTVLLYTI